MRKLFFTKKQIEEYWDEKTTEEKEEFKRVMNDKRAGKKEYVEYMVKYQEGRLNKEKDNEN